jgi:hypothetical protein
VLCDRLDLLPVNSRPELDRGERTHVLPAEKVAGEHGLTKIAMEVSTLRSLKADFLQAIPAHAIGNYARARLQPPNPRRSSVDDTSKFGAEFPRPVFFETLLCFFRREPGWVPIRFLRRFEPSHFAKVGSDPKFGLARSAGRPVGRSIGRSESFAPAAEITGEWEFLHPAMNAGFFYRLKGGGLGLREARLDAAFGENPTSAAGLNQQKFDAAFAHAITDGGDLLPFFRTLFQRFFRKRGRSQELYG